MKNCPQCGIVYTDDDAFCEVDGAALLHEAPAPPPREEREAEKMQDACNACGAENADGGDGYCSICGHKMGDAGGEAHETVTSIPPKTAVGTWSVLGARGADDFEAHDAADHRAVLAVGTDEALAAEARALESLAAETTLPRVLDRGSDARWGAYLALAPIPAGARPLAVAAASMSIAEALSFLDGTLDLAARVERAGFDWLPLRDDVYVDARGGVYLARLRGARALKPRERVDARAVTEAVGGAFLPKPGVDGSTRLVRFLSAHTLIEGDRLCTLDFERAELEAIRADGVVPDASGPLGFVCDPGMKRGYNEDAGAVMSGEVKGEGGTEKWAVLVVCDGVSSSTHAEKASAIAAKTACDTLTHFAKSGDIAHEASTHAVATAVRAAHIAICAQRFDHGADEPPGTTIVVALVYRRRLTVGWVGDSRAYWITSGGGELLTHDHSWVNETVARGEMSEAEALRQPLAHALTRCLGPLEVGDGLGLVEPDVRTRDLPGPGLVVLCSDGLWNYFPAVKDIARLVELASGGAPRGNPQTIARVLVNHALERGGHDNVTVAVYAHE